MGEWPIDSRSIMFGQCGIKKNVFNRCCNKIETHICNTHKAGGVTPPIWSTLFGQCHYASLYLQFARCNVLQQHSKQVQAFREQYSHHKRSRGQCDKYEARKLKSNSLIQMWGWITNHQLTMQCLSHQAAETLGIFLRSWSKKSPAMQSVFLQVCATTDIPVFNSRWWWRAALSSLGPDDLLQMQQRWEGENHREAKCRKTNRRETKCRNGSEEKQNVESVQCAWKPREPSQLHRGHHFSHNSFPQTLWPYLATTRWRSWWLLSKISRQDLFHTYRNSSLGCKAKLLELRYSSVNGVLPIFPQ